MYLKLTKGVLKVIYLLSLGTFCCCGYLHLWTEGSRKLVKIPADCQSVIFYTASSIVGSGEAGAYLQQSMGGRQGTPWTGRQSIAGQHTTKHTLIHTPKGNLERPINR
ncbi:hypothetical protein ATANTOWER_031615 [Ataeniobius toweri]|uniref:Secreted protein n=1 Tax=Ataeniobius toweri TaxID=208326 RepID=A0ABU7ALW9_9TELE|nr:hypothetical protein [Ataeniobius toweri]